MSPRFVSVFAAPSMNAMAAPLSVPPRTEPLVIVMPIAPDLGIALALRADAVGVRTAGVDVSCDFDGDRATEPVGRVALREDAIRSVAEHDDVAVLGDRDRACIAVAADAAGEVLLFEDRNVLVAESAGQSAAAAHALREDAERVDAAREDVAGVRDSDVAAVTAAAAVLTEREAEADVERRDRAEPVLQTAIDVARDTAATADALREDAVRVVAFGDQLAAVRHLDVAAIAARTAAAADAELAAQAGIGRAAGARALGEVLRLTATAADALREDGRRGESRRADRTFVDRRRRRHHRRSRLRCRRRSATSWTRRRPPCP